MRLMAAALIMLSAIPVIAESDHSLTTVILVRHAEKASDTEDPPLSDAGKSRARELRRVLEGTPIDVIYTTQYARTRETAEPLAKALNVEARVFPAGKTYAADLAAHIRREHPGETVLVVGHSNSTVNVMRQLGVANPPHIPESQYDDLFVCSLAGDSAKMVALRYGAVVR